MKAILLCTVAAFSLAACATPKPLCNREAQQWDKFETVEDVCAVPVKPVVINNGGDDPKPNPDPKPDPDPNPDPDPVPVKDDNSDANGKGGNKHDRLDKDKPSQEIAEIKKGVE